jgi:hypothetical protein
MLIILHFMLQRDKQKGSFMLIIFLCMYSSLVQQEKPLLQIALVFRMKAATEEENQGHKKTF